MSVFHHPVRVEFVDCDSAAIVHFSNYLRYMERVEHAFLRSLGVSVATPDGDAHIGFPRVRVECEYFSPARFEDALDGRLRVERIGAKSVTYVIDFHRGDDLLARGRVVTVCCRVAALRNIEPIEIPAFIRDPLAAFLLPTGGPS